MSSTHRTPTTGQNADDVVITSTVLAVVMRVAGPVTVGLLPYGSGTPERQVSVRIGDVVVHLTDPKAAARIRQRWDAGVGLALRLRERVSQTWLQPRPGTYPAAVSVRLTKNVEVVPRFVPADPAMRRPAYLEVRVDQLVWQVFDVAAWRTIGDAWLAAQQHLSP